VEDRAIRANKQIRKQESGLNVNSAKSADRAIRANQAGSASVAFRAGSADTADTAKSALNAGAANGVRPVRVNRAIQDGTSNTLLLSEGGLRIDAECDGNGNAGTLQLRAGCRRRSSRLRYHSVHKPRLEHHRHLPGRERDDRQRPTDADASASHGGG
jgi:hypothetical protein